MQSERLRWTLRPHTALSLRAGRPSGRLAAASIQVSHVKLCIHRKLQSREHAIAPAGRFAMDAAHLAQKRCQWPKKRRLEALSAEIMRQVRVTWVTFRCGFVRHGG